MDYDGGEKSSPPKSGRARLQADRLSICDFFAFMQEEWNTSSVLIMVAAKGRHRQARASLLYCTHAWVDVDCVAKRATEAFESLPVSCWSGSDGWVHLPNFKLRRSL